MTAPPTSALILTAGLGTRLRPLTRTRAKAAVPVAGDALVCRIIRWLAGQGIRQIVLNLHHRPETITGLVGDGSQWGVRVRYSWEPVILGGAGGPRKALPLLGADRFFIVNGDTLTDVHLAALAAAHAAARARVTLALVPNPAPHRYGGVVLDEAGRVRGFTRAGVAPAAPHFVGVQIVDADVFAALPDDRPDDSVNRLYPELLAADPAAIHGWLSGACFHDVGTPADYLATSLAVARRDGHGDRLPAGAGCRIAPGARVDRSALWDDVEVPDNAVLDECVVADGVQVPAGARWHRLAVVRAEGAPEAGESRLGALILKPLEAGAKEARDG